MGVAAVSDNDTGTPRLVTDSGTMIHALDNDGVRELLLRLHPAKIAALIERLDEERRGAVAARVDAALAKRILPHAARRAAHAAAPARSGGRRAGGAAQRQGAAARAQVHNPQGQLQAVRAALAGGRLKRLARLLHRTHPAKVAGLLEAYAARRAPHRLERGDRAGGRGRLPARRDLRRAGGLDPDDLAAWCRRWRWMIVGV